MVLVGIGPKSIGGEGQDGRGRPQRVGVGANAGGGFQAIHAGHLNIHEYGIVAVLVEQGQGFDAAGGFVHRHAVVFQQQLGHFAVHGVVFYQQHAAAAHSRFLHRGQRDLGGLPGLGAGFGQGGDEGERAALPRRALH